ncbi:MAG TPA: glycosyl hydrolase [Dictyoglomaceae bacterium]|nr:glycosyl hydrolase [Dictyoglomaceae bacterium]
MNNFNFSEGIESFNSKELKFIEVKFSIEDDSYYDFFIHHSPNQHFKSLAFLNDLALGEINFFTNENPLYIGELKLTKGKYSLKIIPVPQEASFNSLEIKKKDRSNFRYPEFRLSNSKASDECKYLMEFFEKIYTNKIIAGQHTNTAVGPEFAYIKYITGKLPALRGFDLLSYSSFTITEEMKPFTISEIEGNKGSVEKAVEWGKNYRGIVTICWHWYAPLGGRNQTFYTINTDFDLEKALTNGTKENLALLKDIDLIAKELLKLKEAKVPVLWRPLHEADGGWFWWGAKGPQNYKKLYYLLYEILTERYDLNNLIWVWNAPHPDWTISEDSYDIAGIDTYVPPKNYGPMKFSFDYLGRLTSYKKPLALTENGPIPDPDLLFSYESYFLWFMPWFGNFVFDENINSTEHLKKVYNHEKVITLNKFQSYIN